ncbi:MAG: hypothetical protein JST00_11290 [Deltaproteobacteria bacterium]|nr:hypothetical protein [Deltaproteobacteria bacterium]
MRLPSLLSLTAVVALGCTQEGLVGSQKAGAPLVPIVEMSIAAGGDGTCVRTSNGEARCWGSNGNGGLGTGGDGPSVSAAPIMPVNLDGVRALYGGELARCALRINGELACWGRVGVANAASARFIREELVVTNPFAMVDAIGEVAQFAVGRFFMCSLTTAGDVRCFGRNDKGQLGLGDTEDQLNLTTVKGFDGPVTSISASMGGAFTCATTKPGAVYCWGNTTANIASDEPAVVVSPRRIEGLPEAAAQVAVGGAHACARLGSGRVACWGLGTEGQLGDGARASSTAPVLANVTDIVAIAAGRAHTCAIRSEGSTFCWGDDAKGQAGATGTNRLPSIVVEAAFKTRSIACGLDHSCAWGEGGRVVCWGDNALSQLGPKQGTF